MACLPLSLSLFLWWLRTAQESLSAPPPSIRRTKDNFWKIYSAAGEKERDVEEGSPTTLFLLSFSGVGEGGMVRTEAAWVEGERGKKGGGSGGGAGRRIRQKRGGVSEEEREGGRGS